MCHSGHVFQETTLPKPQTFTVNSLTEVAVVDGTVTKPPPQAPISLQNPSAMTLPPQPISSGPARMVTRVSSGAIRHKSVGELLGEKDVHACFNSRSDTLVHT